jgi:hypothetical protein
VLLDHRLLVAGPLRLEQGGTDGSRHLRSASISGNRASKSPR